VNCTRVCSCLTTLSGVNSRFTGDSLSPSFADVVKGKGKVPLEGSSSDPDHSSCKGKEPMDSSMPPTPPATPADAAGGGFMADACRQALGYPPSNPRLLWGNGSLSPDANPGDG
jgi:hypothetical protein